MHITIKGQVTIPNEFRIKYGLLPHTEVEFTEIEGRLCLMKVRRTKKESRGQRIIRRMQSAKVNRNMTTDEILALTRGFTGHDK